MTKLLKSFWPWAASIVLLSLALNLWGSRFGVAGQPSWMPFPLKMENYLVDGLLDNDYGPLPQLVAGRVCRLADRLWPSPQPGRWHWVLAQRWFNSLLGALSVALLMAAAVAAYDRRTALLAGLFGACAEGLVFWSKTESVNSQATLWAMAVLLCAVLIGRYRHPALWLAAGACCGALLATKETYFGLALLLPVLLAWFYRRGPERWARPRWLLLGAILFALSCAGLYLLCGALDWAHFSSRLVRYSTPDLATTMPGRTQEQSTLFAYYASQVTNVALHAGRALFPGALLLVLIGLIGRRRPGWGLRLLPAALFGGALLLFMLAMPFTIGVKRVIESYDVLPLGLALTPLAAGGVLNIARLKFLPRPLSLAAAALICCYALAVGLAVDLNLSNNTRYGLLELGRIDPGPHRVSLDFPIELAAPLLPTGWERIAQPQDADYLIVLEDQEPQALRRGWQVKYRVPPPPSARLTWFEYSPNQSYLVLDCPGACSLR